MSEVLPQLIDAAPGLYKACVKTARSGHKSTCDTALSPKFDVTDCTCGCREAMKAVAYARGDDPIEVDLGNYEV